MAKQNSYRGSDSRTGLSYLRIQERYNKKNNISFLDNILKYKELFGIFMKLSIAIGAVITFMYCFFYIHYIPYGLGIGDSINYIFISLGFGILYTLFVFMHAMPPILWIKFKQEKRSYFLSFMGGVLFIITLLLDWHLLDSFFYIILPILYIVCIFLFISHGWYDRNTFMKVKIGFSLVLFIAPLFIQGMFSFILDRTLTGLSIKTNNSSIQLNDEEFSFLNRLSIEQGVLLKTSCNINDKNKIIHDVNILWSIGKESLIEIENIRLAINNDSLKKIKIHNPKKCIFKEFRDVFTQGSAKFENDIGKEIDKFVKLYKGKIEELVVYGTADSKSNKKGGGNKKLSEERAYSIKNLLNDVENVKYEGLANFEYNTYCKNKGLDSLDVKDCEAINSGVILKLRLKTQEETEKLSALNTL